MRISVPTFIATIFVGFKDNKTGEFVDSVAVIKNIIEPAVNQGWCLTVDYTTFYYKYGQEPGFRIGVINYPRFPESPERLKERTLGLATALLHACNQTRCSVVFSDETVMLTNEDKVEEYAG